jgi:hypothetical protein
MASNLATVVAALKTRLETISGTVVGYCDYSVLNQGKLISFVLWPDSGDMHDIGMGGVWGYTDAIVGEAFIRDTRVLSTWGLSVFTLVDSVKDAIDADETLGSTVDAVAAQYTWTAEAEINGTAYKVVTFRFNLEVF